MCQAYAKSQSKKTILLIFWGDNFGSGRGAGPANNPRKKIFNFFLKFFFQRPEKKGLSTGQFWFCSLPFARNGSSRGDEAVSHFPRRGEEKSRRICSIGEGLKPLKICVWFPFFSPLILFVSSFSLQK